MGRGTKAKSGGRWARTGPGAPPGRRGPAPPSAGRRTGAESSAPPGATRKGARTRERILDAAERLFADRGYEAASLREIATAAGVRQPGLYNYFADKRSLYAGVLDRALQPMLDALAVHLAEAATPDDYTALPGLMTDLLAAHPRISGLFQQALHGDADSPGHRLMRDWLDRLFRDGLEAVRAAGGPAFDEADLAIRVIGMFNLCAGYFLSQRAFGTMVEGELTDPTNLERQKRLLTALARAALSAPIIDGARAST